jgi:long-chain acyl-CoA synthetase
VLVVPGLVVVVVGFAVVVVVGFAVVVVVDLTVVVVVGFVVVVVGLVVVVVFGGFVVVVTGRVVVVVALVVVGDDFVVVVVTTLTVVVGPDAQALDPGNRTISAPDTTTGRSMSGRTHPGRRRGSCARQPESIAVCIGRPARFLDPPLRTRSAAGHAGGSLPAGTHRQGASIVHPGLISAATPDKPAIIMGSGRQVTYAELDRRSNQVANLLRSLGLEAGDHLAFQLHNEPEFFDLVWGAHRAGIVYTALSSRLSAAETEYIIDDCEAKAVVVDHDLHDHLRELAAKPLPGLLARFGLGAPDGALPAGWLDFATAADAQPATPVDSYAGDDMLYSSGTTGRPKGIMRPLGRFALSDPDPVTLLCQLAFGFDADTRYLSPAPLYHAAPLRFTRAAQRVGGTVVQMERFDPEEYLRLVERYRITASQLVPTMFVRLLKLPDEVRRRYDVSSLQTIIHAAAPCPVPVKQQMIDWWGPIIWEYYAGTEGNGMVLCNSTDWLAHPGTVGRPISAEVHIVGDEGEEQPAGQQGTVFFGGGVDFEYHNDPEKTAKAHHPKGWSTLGDIGYLDDEGFLFLTDRQANMIISGGVNIYPQEAENVLTLHPAVADVAVFGVPNAEMGEEVKAVVQPVEWSQAGPELEAELIAYCRERLAHFKCPRTVDFDPELPRHPTGKLYKRLLKDRYWEGHTSRIA